MCLAIKKFAKKKIAKEDIICYKHIERDTKDKYLTPFRYCPVKIGETYTSKFTKKSSFNWTYIYEGLHSYISLEEARYVAKQHHDVLVECIIPKGSEYYKGSNFGSFTSNYASNKIKYVKIIEEYTLS